jgi:FAD synthase
VEDVIKRHLKPKRYKELMASEKLEQTLIRKVSDRFVVFGENLTVGERIKGDDQ